MSSNKSAVLEWAKSGGVCTQTRRPNLPCVKKEQVAGGRAQLEQLRRARKNEREKGRRQELAYAFQQLMNLMDFECNKSDRTKILNEAHNRMQRLMYENEQLRRELECSRSPQRTPPVQPTRTSTKIKAAKTCGPWQRVVNGDMEYYWNRETNETSWTHPEQERKRSRKRKQVVNERAQRPVQRARMQHNCTPSFATCDSSSVSSPPSSPDSLTSTQLDDLDLLGGGFDTTQFLTADRDLLLASHRSSSPVALPDVKSDVFHLDPSSEFPSFLP